MRFAPMRGGCMLMNSAMPALLTPSALRPEIARMPHRWMDGCVARSLLARAITCAGMTSLGCVIDSLLRGYWKKPPTLRRGARASLLCVRDKCGEHCVVVARGFSGGGR